MEVSFSFTGVIESPINIHLSGPQAGSVITSCTEQLTFDPTKKADLTWFVVSVDDIFDIAIYPLNAWSWFNGSMKMKTWQQIRDYYDQCSGQRNWVILVDSSKHWTTVAVRNEALAEIKKASRWTNRCIWFCEDEIKDVLKTVACY